MFLSQILRSRFFRLRICLRTTNTKRNRNDDENHNQQPPKKRNLNDDHVIRAIDLRKALIDNYIRGTWNHPVDHRLEYQVVAKYMTERKMMNGMSIEQKQTTMKTISNWLSKDWNFQTIPREENTYKGKLFRKLLAGAYLSPCQLKEIRCCLDDILMSKKNLKDDHKLFMSLCFFMEEKYVNRLTHYEHSMFRSWRTKLHLEEFSFTKRSDILDHKSLLQNKAKQQTIERNKRKKREQDCRYGRYLESNVVRLIDVDCEQLEDNVLKTILHALYDLDDLSVDRETYGKMIHPITFAATLRRKKHTNMLDNISFMENGMVAKTIYQQIFGQKGESYLEEKNETIAVHHALNILEMYEINNIQKRLTTPEIFKTMSLEEKKRIMVCSGRKRNNMKDPGRSEEVKQYAIDNNFQKLKLFEKPLKPRKMTMERWHKDGWFKSVNKILDHVFSVKLYRNNIKSRTILILSFPINQ